MSNTPRAFIYKKAIPPCKDCLERYIGCHSSCQKYIKWKNQNIAMGKAIINKYKSDRKAEDYLIKEKQKRKAKVRK
jgi:hypothetical protein